MGKNRLLKTRRLQECDMRIALQLTGVPGFLKPKAFLCFLCLSEILVCVLQHHRSNSLRACFAGGKVCTERIRRFDAGLILG